MDKNLNRYSPDDKFLFNINVLCLLRRHKHGAKSEGSCKIKRSEIITGEYRQHTGSCMMVFLSILMAVI